MKWLDKFSDYIETQFNNPNWANQLLEDSNKDNDLFKELLLNKEKQVLIKSFEYLCYSIIEGEYVINQDDFNKKTKKLIKRVGSLQSQLIDDEDEQYVFTALFDDEKFLFTLKKVLELYLRFSNYFNRILKNPHKTFVFDYHDVLSKKEFRSYYEQANLLEKNLFSLFNDLQLTFHNVFFLKNSEGNIDFKELLLNNYDLESYKASIQIGENNTFHKIIDLAKEINTFLLRKLIIRKNQNEETYNQKYVFKGNEYDFSLNEHSLNLGIFDKWDSYSQNHFLSENDASKGIELKKNAEDYTKNNNLKLNFLHTHNLIKYFKDINKNTSKLKSLKHTLSNFIPKNEFDNYAKNISSNYIANNILSLECEIQQNKSKKDFNYITSLKKDIEELQNNSLVNNFFPYYKLCEYLKKSISKAISSKDVFDKKYIKKIRFAENQLSELSSLLKKYKTNLKWSKEHLFNSYQLPFDECKIPYKTEEGTKLEIFISSSFSLPIDYDKYDLDIKDTEEFIRTYSYETKSLKNIFSLTQTLESKENEIQDYVKNNFKKNIEILGIFSAIIALLFQTATTSQGTQSFENKFLTLLVMFVILLSFILILKTYIPNKKVDIVNKQLNIIIIIFIPTVIIISLILLKLVN